MSSLALLLAFLCLPTAHATPVYIVVEADDPLLRFGAAELCRALEASGLTVATSSSAATVPPGGATVSLALAGGQRGDRLGAVPEAARAAWASPEAFAIYSPVAGSWVVIGSDPRGAMYGAIQFAELIRQRGLPPPSYVRARAPFCTHRQLKVNLPLPGVGYLSQESVAHGQWFYDLSFWQRFLDHLARSHYNVLSLWSAHPFEHMVRLDKYPEASPFTDEELAQKKAFWHSLLRMAGDRGLDVYLVTWNIHVSDAFARAHGIPAAGFDSPLVRDYMRECVRSVLTEYPELAGIGTCPGEQMGHDDAWREQWIKETYLAGMRDAGRTVALLHRSWGVNDPRVVEEVIAREFPGPVWVEMKYNGEHMYSSERPHFFDPRWLGLTPRHYRLLWHLRNDCLYLFRWGSPRFAAETIRNLRATGDAAGYLVGSEVEGPGTDYVHTPQAAEHQTWHDEFERHWFRYVLWGRMGYDPDTPEETWRQLFRERYGAAGDALFEAECAGSEIIPQVTAFHWNYMNGDWYPEGNVGGWNTGAGRGANFRDRALFHSVLEWIFNHTIEDALLNPIEYAYLVARRLPLPADAHTPLRVADCLEGWARACLSAADRALQAGDLNGEARCAVLDAQAVGDLGLYYAEKLRGATALARVIWGDETARPAAIAHLEAARDHWRRLAQLAGEHYAEHEIWLMGRFSHAMYLPDVEHDIEIARTLRPDPVGCQKAGIVGTNGRTAPGFSFASISGRLDLGVPGLANPARLLEGRDLSPGKYAALILGRNAQGFNAGRPEQKRLLVDWVAAGQNLVIFNQDFPGWDTSWLPARVVGSDADLNTVRPVGDHPLVCGLTAADLTWEKAGNDVLASVSPPWIALTDPIALAVCEHGRGRIVWCQLRVIEKWQEAGAQRVLKRLADWLGLAGKPVLVLEEGTGPLLEVLASLGCRPEVLK